MGSSTSDPRGRIIIAGSRLRVCLSRRLNVDLEPWEHENTLLSNPCADMIPGGKKSHIALTNTDYTASSMALYVTDGTVFALRRS